MINILFIRTRTFNDPTGDDNDLVRSVHTAVLPWQLSYCKCLHDHDGHDDGDVGDGDDHKVRKGSSGRSKETYKIVLDILKS